MILKYNDLEMSFLKWKRKMKNNYDPSAEDFWGGFLQGDHTERKKIIVSSIKKNFEKDKKCIDLFPKNLRRKITMMLCFNDDSML